MFAGLEITSLVLFFLSLLPSFTVSVSVPEDGPLIGDCCTFQVSQEGCDDTFVLKDDSTMACTLTTQTSLPGGSCIGLDSSDRMANNGGIPPIELLAANPVLEVQCLAGSETTGVDSQCVEYYEATFIALKIEFRISAENISGVMFNLNSTTENCHHLTLPDGSGRGLALNGTFTYTSFVGLHPGSEYALQATTLAAGGSRNGYSKRVFRVPDCWSEALSSFDVNFYCTRPSPANWAPTLTVEPNSVDVTFTIWPDLSTFARYKVYLYFGASVGDHNDVADDKVLFTNIPANIKTMEIRGREEKVMHHNFGIDLPGQYTIAVLPQPDDPCIADSHWGGERCIYAKETVELTAKDVPVTDKLTTEVKPEDKTASSEAPSIPQSNYVWPKISSPALVTSSALTSRPTRTSPTEPPDLEPLYLAIIVTMALFLTLLAVSILCCCNDRTISSYLLHTCKNVFCDRDPRDLEVQTVTSSWVGNRYQPVPLRRPSLPEAFPSTLDDIPLEEGQTPPSTCSESTSDSMSTVLTKKWKHGRGETEHV